MESPLSCHVRTAPRHRPAGRGLREPRPLRRAGAAVPEVLVTAGLPQAESPPSTWSTWPVMNPARGEREADRLGDVFGATEARSGKPHAAPNAAASRKAGGGQGALHPLGKTVRSRVASAPRVPSTREAGRPPKGLGSLSAAGDHAFPIGRRPPGCRSSEARQMADSTLAESEGENLKRSKLALASGDWQRAYEFAEWGVSGQPDPKDTICRVYPAIALRSSAQTNGPREPGKRHSKETSSRCYVRGLVLARPARFPFVRGVPGGGPSASRKWSRSR